MAQPASKPKSIEDLSPEDIAKNRRKFNVFDLDKDGLITHREMATVSKVMGYKLSREELLVS